MEGQGSKFSDRKGMSIRACLNGYSFDFSLIVVVNVCCWIVA